MYGEGISKEGSIVDACVNAGIINKAGSWFSYNDIKLGQGRENAKEFLRQNPEIYQEIENTVRKKYGLGKKDNNETEDSELIKSE
jgi:recombination protein RecA